MKRLISWVWVLLTGRSYWEVNKRLNGWDYILWANSCDSGIARVYKDQTGVAYYWRYRNTRVVDRILTPEQVLWLTCDPSKFFSQDVPE